MGSQNHLVTIICLCFQHENFILEALNSVVKQHYPFIELIVVDDASKDNSVAVIETFIEEFPTTQFISNSENIGNCKSFNKALKIAKGEFIIDLAGDDILLPDRVARGVEKFQQLPDSYGVHYGNISLIDENGSHLENPAIPKVPEREGDLYTSLIQKYFISAPSMMIKKSVFDSLEGYDENLTYEDFDFWIRSSREFLYTYSDEILVRKRIHSNNLSKQQVKFRNKHISSTYAVCCKAFLLNKSEDEFKALKNRALYEARRSLQFGDLKYAILFMKLYFKC